MCLLGCFMRKQPAPQPPPPSPPPPSPPSPPPPPPPWYTFLEPLWSDTFDGDTLDESKWEPMLGDGTQFGLPPGWGNNELEWYTNRSENVRVEGGLLVIQAQAEPPGSPYGPYTSGRIRTCGKFAICPSADYPTIRIEARMKLPAGQGMWPALWMLPEDWAYGSWPASGEIDIIECVNTMEWCVASLHHGGVGSRVMLSDGTPGPLSHDFHTFALEWEAGEMRWYLDGKQYFTAYSSAGGTRPGGWFTLGSNGSEPVGPDAPYDRPFHLLINLAVGGEFPNVSPQAVAATMASGPKQLVVDYVKVWAKPAPAPF